VLISFQVAPPSRLSKMPDASAPASTRPCAAVRPETLDSFMPSSPYVSPSLDCSHVSPRSLLCQIDAPCHSLAAAA
jgi:hypothetical protein